jgi:uncharacterized membrane protein
MNAMLGRPTRLGQFRLWARDQLWIFPLLYSAGAYALAVGLANANLGAFYLTHVAPDSARQALAAIAAGMIAFTGLVITMILLIIQFGSQAYSPRLVREVRNDWVLKHALATFVATFVFALTTLNEIQHGGNAGFVPGAGLDVGLIFVAASIVAFLALIHRITTRFQLVHLLRAMGDLARAEIERGYPHDYAAGAIEPVPTLGPVTQVVRHHGEPQVTSRAWPTRIESLAEQTGGVLELPHAVGDTVYDGEPIVLVRGGSRRVAEKTLRDAVGLRRYRTPERDLRYAMRLIVDIGVRALSSSVNDPTTAVQALDELEDLLRRLATRSLSDGVLRARDGAVLAVEPSLEFEHCLQLALTEIRQFGASSTQVTRRLRALLVTLAQTVPEPRRAAVSTELQLLDASVARSIPDPADRELALGPDRQGIGT